MLLAKSFFLQNVLEFDLDQNDGLIFENLIYIQWWYHVEVSTHQILLFVDSRVAHHLILGVTAPQKVNGISKMTYIQCKIVFAIIWEVLNQFWGFLLSNIKLANFGWSTSNVMVA